MSANLVAHKNCIIVDSEDQVRSIETPPRTESFAPIPHGAAIDLLEETLAAGGIGVDWKQYALSVKKDKNNPEALDIVGDQMFALWKLNKEDNGHRWSIGMRNSHDKSFAFSLVAGIEVFVCDNLAFTGEYLATRRHTTRFDQVELKRLTRGAVTKVLRRIGEFSMWHRALKHVPITEAEAMMIFVDGFESKVFPPSRFRKVLECWREEIALNDGAPPNMYNAFGAFTRYARELDAFKIVDKTRIATDVIDQHLLLRQPVQEMLVNIGGGTSD